MTRALSHRCRSARSRLSRRVNHHRLSRARPLSHKTILAYLKGQGRGQMGELRDLFLVTQRKTLEDVEPLWWLRWLLRRYFAWRGYACRSHCGRCNRCYASIEYAGVFDDFGIARYVASQYGGEVKPIPFNAALPFETVSYKTSESPCSEEAQWYRRGIVLPFVAVPRDEFEALGEQIVELAEHAKHPIAV